MPNMRSRSIRGFLRKLASADATPGGGSVAALSGALSADLGCMVCRLTMNKVPSDDLADLLQYFTSLEKNFLDLADADELAFSAVMDAYHLDRAVECRPEMIATTLLMAIAVPHRVAEKGIDLLERLCTLAPLGSKRSVSNAGVAAHLAEAAVTSAILNVRINLAYAHNDAEVKKIKMEAEEIEKRCSDLSSRVISSVAARIAR